MDDDFNLAEADEMCIMSPSFCGHVSNGNLG